MAQIFDIPITSALILSVVISATMLSFRFDYRPGRRLHNVRMVLASVGLPTARYGDYRTGPTTLSSGPRPLRRQTVSTTTMIGMIVSNRIGRIR
jgi:hypothetical protein